MRRRNRASCIRTGAKPCFEPAARVGNFGEIWGIEGGVNRGDTENAEERGKAVGCFAPGA